MVSNIQRILIINLAFIGDVVLSTPVARALRETYPKACIDLLVVPVTAPIAELNPYIDHVHIYDKNGRHKKWRHALQLVRELRQYRYDLVICTNFAVRGAMVAWAIGAPNRVGYDAQQGKWFLTHVASANRPVIRHEADNYLDVLQPLGITTTDTSLRLLVREEDQQAVTSRLHRTSGKALILLCPIGSYERKSWSTAGYVTLIQELSSEADIVLIGGNAEKPFLEELNQQAGGGAQVFGGTLNLKELTALISTADLLITVDTAPLHIAEAVDTPVLALFGPTNPATWGPRRQNSEVFYRPQACAPCWGKGPCGNHQCMADLAATDVIAAAQKMIRG